MKRGLVILGIVIILLVILIISAIIFFHPFKNPDSKIKSDIDVTHNLSGPLINLGMFNIVDFNDPSIELVYFSNISQILGNYSAIYYNKKNNEIIKFVAFEYPIELGLPTEEYSRYKTIYCGKYSYSFIHPVFYNSLINEDYHLVFRHNIINTSEITCYNIVKKEIILPLRYSYNLDEGKINKLNKVHNLSSVASSGDFQSDKPVNFSYLSYDEDKIIIKEIQGISYSNLLDEIGNVSFVIDKVDTTPYSGGDIVDLGKLGLNRIFYIKECSPRDFILIEVTRSREREKTLKDVIDIVNC